jgi:hypothetical protein
MLGVAELGALGKSAQARKILREAAEHTAAAEQGQKPIGKPA